ncbi:MAG TPA: hypothetical protein ENK46_05690 [Flavobacteriia bacterium]|nr:hypothetical protein [Flavobacteriia bacterium]
MRRALTAPKATKDLPPVEFINQFMQHRLPRYFQKSRQHGLHSPNTRRQYEADWDETMKRPSQLIKTLVQILKELLQKPPFTCEVYKGEEYEIVYIYPDKEWKYKHIRDFRPRPPPPLPKHE